MRADLSGVARKQNFLNSLGKVAREDAVYLHLASSCKRDIRQRSGSETAC